MEGRLLARARADLAERRRQNQQLESTRRAEVYARVPEIETLDRQIRGLMTELVGLALGRSSRSADELEEESLALQARRAELLRANGWPENYLDEIISCPYCRDSGWLDGQEKICSCLTALYKQEQTRELSPLLRQGNETFERFRLDLYATEPLREGEPSPREQMERVYTLCKRYAETFGPGSGNLLFTGEPGLGKTFLSAAIARVVAADERGYSVAYDTVTGLLAAFEKEKFGREDEQADAASRVRQLMGCDLLILDDLGTEMSTAFTQNALYTLLDGRLRAGKKTIVSTNLDRDGIAERYGAQLASRLSGEYLWLQFLGRDIRPLKKERKL